MKATKRMIANIVEIVVGVTLTILGYTGVVDSYWSGMGTALIFVGIIFLFRTLRYKTNTEYKEKVDVEVNDERNKYLRMMAWSWTGYFFVLIAAFASIIFRILLICLILASRAPRHLPAHLPDTRQQSPATPARSSA